MSNVAIPRLLQLLAERVSDDLDVVGLSSALRPSQADIVSAIALLVGEGRLDAATLRPPLAAPEAATTATTDSWLSLPPTTATTSPTAVTASGAWLDNVGSIDVDAAAAEALDDALIVSAEPVLAPVEPRGPAVGCVKTGHRSSDEPSAPLVAALRAEAERRGLSQQRTSIALFGVNSRLAMIARRGTVRKATAEKIRAWIADKPSLAMMESPAEREPAAAPCASPTQSNRSDVPPPPLAPVRLPGAALAAELDAFIERHDLSKSRVARHLFGTTSGVEVLRKSAPYKAKTEKVRAFLDAAPPAELKRARAAPRPPPERRDPTQKPDTPLMDLAERQRVNGQRHNANIKRGREREATARLDAGQEGRNNFEKATMAHIEERREAEHRQTDPVEQAKLALQRRGRVVHSAMIHGGRKDRFMVGGQRDPRTGRLKELTPAELIDLAEKVTGTTFRRVA